MRSAADNAQTCAPPAEDLHPGIPYVRGWRTANNATTELAARLTTAGLDDGFGALKAEVNVHGDGLVNLGPVPADTIHRLTTLLTNGLCAELGRLAARGEAAGSLTDALVLGLCEEIDRLPCAQEPGHDDRPTAA
jgi:hypothetical protein